MENNGLFCANHIGGCSRGYILKYSSQETMLEAVRTVSRGDIYLSSKACNVLVEDYLRLLSNENVESDSPLSEREIEVLRLLVKGRAGKQIADTLCISKNTVDTHRHRIMDKLVCNSTAELTKYAIGEGFFALD